MSKLWIFLCLGVWCSAATAGMSVQHSWDGSQTVPVHRIPIYTDEGELILPAPLGGNLPFSASFTCGVCHDYKTINQGLHFSAGTQDSNDGRPGEPWFWVDELTGTVLPISYRDWHGCWSPESLGLSPWRYAQLFGRHLPGGGMVDLHEVSDDPHARWELSGNMEINCLACHSHSPRQDMAEWAKQIARENFRWAATAASGVGTVGGMASRLPEYWDHRQAVNPDDREYAVPPSVRYDRTNFDHKNQVWFHLGRPLDQRCLHCHSVAPVGVERQHIERDVHTPSGLACVDCHRGGIEHDIIRGYLEEHTAYPERHHSAEFTCQGCHLGVADPSVQFGVRQVGGRYGAPRPQHRGIPEIHFKKLSCTACHAGAIPEVAPTRVRLSRANRLGIVGRADWSTEHPIVQEPVFVKTQNEYLEPHRLVWPSFWVKLDNENAIPLVPDDLEHLAIGILDAEQQVGTVLAALEQTFNASGVPALIAPGRIYRADVDMRVQVDWIDTPGLNADAQWVWETPNGEIEPLLPEFDAQETLTPAMQMLILNILQSLEHTPRRAGQPVFAIGEKIFQRTFDGFLETTEQSMNAASGLGWMVDGDYTPLVQPFLIESVLETTGTEHLMTETQVELMLRKIEDELELRAGFITGGYLFTLTDEQQGLKHQTHPAAEPVSWALAHPVRPSRHALGARKCEDCHSADSPFFFGQVIATGPLKTTRRVVRSMHLFQGQDKTFTRLFGLSFKLRWLYKTVGIMAIVLVLAVLLVYALMMLYHFTHQLNRR